MKKILLIFMVLFASATLSAQNEVLTNKSIIDMVDLGFEDDIIITKINTSSASFDTSIETLKALKEKGISSDIIVTMMQANKQSQDEAKSQKQKSGIYFKANSEFHKIFPTVFSGTKTNTLGAAFTYGIASAKIKSVMNGEHSNNIIETNIPDFYFFFDEKGQANFAASASNWWFTVASSPNEFALAKLNKRKGKRELGTGEVNLYAGNSVGIDEKSIIGFEIESINELEFKVTPKQPLEPGEYCFFYQGIIPQGGYNNQSVFDFSISEHSKQETLYKNGNYVWIIKNGKPRNYEISSTEVRKDGVYYILNQRNSWDKLECKENECYPTKEEANSATGIKE